MPQFGINNIKLKTLSLPGRSGTCNISRFSSNRPVLSIIHMLKLEHMEIRQYNIIPDSPRLSATVSAYELAKQHQLQQCIVKHPANMTIPPEPLVSQLEFDRTCNICFTFWQNLLVRAMVWSRDATDPPGKTSCETDTLTIGQVQWNCCPGEFFYASTRPSGCWADCAHQRQSVRICDRNQDTQLDRVASEQQQTKTKAQRSYYIHKKKSLQSGHSF